MTLSDGTINIQVNDGPIDAVTRTEPLNVSALVSAAIWNLLETPPPPRTSWETRLHR